MAGKYVRRVFNVPNHCGNISSVQHYSCEISWGLVLFCFLNFSSFVDQFFLFFFSSFFFCGITFTIFVVSWALAFPYTSLTHLLHPL